MSHPVIVIPNLTPNGEALRHYFVGVETSDVSNPEAYAVFIHNIATGEIRTSQVGLSAVQAIDVATVIYDILYCAE
jgi:hypothetical protein